MPAIKLLALYTLITATGYYSVSYSFPRLRAWTKAILSVPVGASLFMVYVNICVHLAGYEAGIHIAIIVLAAQLAYTAWRYRVEIKPEAEGPRLTLPQTGVLLAVLLLQGGLVNLNNHIYLTHDIISHGVVFSQYQEFGLSYPVDTIFTAKGAEVELNKMPKRLLYHFGYDLYNAGLSAITGFPYQWVYFLISSLSLFLIFAVVFLLVYHSTSNFNLAIITLFILPLSSYIFPVTMRVANLPIFPPDGTYIIFSIVQGMSFIYLATCHGDDTNRRRYIFLMTMLIAAQEITNESFLMIAGPTAFVAILFYNRKAIAPFIISTLSALTLIYFFGGIIGGLLRGDSQYTYNYLVGNISLRLRTFDIYYIDPFYGQAFPIYSWGHLWANFVFPLSYAAFFALAIMAVFKRRKVPVAATQLWMVSFMGFSIPGLIDFGYPQNVDAIRYVSQTCWALGPAGIVSAYYLLRPAVGNIKRIQYAQATLLIIIALVMGWGYPDYDKTIKKLYANDLRQRFNVMRDAIRPNPYFEGKKSQYFKTSEEEYMKLLKRVKKKQLDRNVLIPYYHWDEENK